MKEQIIKDMAKEMCEVCFSKPFCKAISAHCPIAIRDAERLYNAGYRKQKEGKWIEKSEDKDEYYEYIFKCSVCGKWAIIEEEEFEEEEFDNFCPNCGAHMRGGKANA